MKKSYLVVLGLFFSFGLNAQSKGSISGSKINYDPATGNTSISRAVIAPDAGVKIQAGHAQFTVDENELPRSVELTQNVVFRIDGTEGRADTAIYYPELQLLSSAQLYVSSGSASGGLVVPNVMVSYTCSSGTLYANGASTGGGSVCLGNVEIGCSGAGGNSVYMIRLKYACSGG